jgi:hypothetical protein
MNGAYPQQTRLKRNGIEPRQFGIDKSVLNVNEYDWAGEKLSDSGLADNDLNRTEAQYGKQKFKLI